MRSGRERDTDSSGEISDASVWLMRSFACQRCCVGASSRMLHRALFDGDHAVRGLSKSSDALCFASSCAFSPNAAVNAVEPAMKSGSLTVIVMLGENATVPGASETRMLALTVCPGSLAGN